MARRNVASNDRSSGKAEALIFAPHQFAAAAYRSFFPHDSPCLFAFNHAIRGSTLATECDDKKRSSNEHLGDEYCGGSHATVRADRFAGVVICAYGRGVCLRQRTI